MSYYKKKTEAFFKTNASVLMIRVANALICFSI